MNISFITKLIDLTAYMPAVSSIYGEMHSLEIIISAEVCESLISELKDHSKLFKQTVGPGVDNISLMYKFETLDYKNVMFSSETYSSVLISISNPSKDSDWYYGNDKNKVKRTVKVVIYKK